MSTGFQFWLLDVLLAVVIGVILTAQGAPAWGSTGFALVIYTLSRADSARRLARQR